ncbi:MAG TPA: GrpB family protein, partial [Streptosporangiaceae bacterium]|nr:GrpB family protein [Streptosporangiaceae bacterium]
MTDQPVYLAEHDRAWPGMFAEQQARVNAILAPWLAAPIEHIGSTSVPGLPAKPVIDMLAPVRSLATAGEAVAPLTEDGWLFWPDDPCRDYRLWFLRPRPEERTH